VGFIELRDGSAGFTRIWSSMDLLPLAGAAAIAALALRRLLA
jgi:hypothetical protein